MLILGIYGGLQRGNYDASAALISDGKIIAIAEEERFTLVKKAPGLLPSHAIRYCLKAGNVSIQDIDCVVYPGSTYVNMVSRLETFFRFHFGHTPPIQLLNHHLAHASSVFRVSGLEQSVILTIDYSGDQTATAVWYGNGKNIELLFKEDFPNSLGLFYAMVTQYLGFEFGEDEYKVMGLAAYCEDGADLSWLLDTSNEVYQLSSEYMRTKEVKGEPSFSPQENLYSSLMKDRLGEPRVPGAELGETHQYLARGAQLELEKALKNLTLKAIKQTGCRNICLAGGVALNCSANMHIANLPEVERCFVAPFSGDTGLAIGAAMERYSNEENITGSFELKSPYWGPEYSDDEIESALKNVGVKYEKIENPSKTAGELISQGKIIGWFQGRMEIGPRALGNRSILGDPRDPKMKDSINHAVKYRESFRPFAPSVLSDKAHEFFEEVFYSPYMTFVFRVKDDKKDLIPSVVHADQTSRIQSVTQDMNPLYYELITEFYRQTDIPMVINTSFNVKGQPIVENPIQAVSTFYGSGLNALVIGKYLLQKES